MSLSRLTGVTKYSSSGLRDLQKERQNRLVNAGIARAPFHTRRGFQWPIEYPSQLWAKSLSTTTILFRTTFTQTIKLNLLLTWLLGSNPSLSQLCFKKKDSQFTNHKPIYLVREKKCLTCFLNKALCQAWLLLFFRDDFKGSESQNTSFCKSRRLGNLSPSLLSFKIPEESELDWKKTHQRYKGA